MKQEVQEYLAVFLPEETGGYTVIFPELPGCVTCGKTFEHAQLMAKEAVELWLSCASEDYTDLRMKSRAITAPIEARIPTRKYRSKKVKKITKKAYATAHVS